MRRVATSVARVQIRLAVLVVVTSSLPLPAFGGFGFELSEWEGRPGELVEVEGSDLLTCCPTNTPSQAELVLEVDPSRPSTWIVLFEGVVANSRGDFATTFVVPRLPAGDYELNYCARNPPNVTGAGTRTCVPAQHSFTILDPVSYWWTAAAALAMVVVLALVVLSKRRRGLTPDQITKSQDSTAAGESSQVGGRIETLSGRPVSSSGLPR